MKHAKPRHKLSDNLPDWVSDDIRLYLDHTENGRPIRSLARDRGWHASTVLRKVRKTESRRDDPLIDRALVDLGAYRRAQMIKQAVHHAIETNIQKKADPDMADEPVDDQTLRRGAIRVLGALLKPGAVLAVVPTVENAVVVRENPDGRPFQTASVQRRVAEAMAVQGWITCEKARGKVLRYYITQSGRMALNQFLAEAESQKAGFSEAAVDFQAGGAKDALFGSDAAQKSTRTRSRRPVGAEAPLHVLARRREKSGAPYLSADLVVVGERLRMDFELAQLEASTGPGWDAIMSGPSGGAAGTAGQGPDMRQSEARTRLEKALTFLGPELGDVALITCCHQQGMEHAEKQLVMPARSGKYVLRIALNMLARFYQDQSGDDHNLIY